MTVRTIHPDTLAAAQTAWLEFEYDARAAYALTRLERLDRLAPNLIAADLCDAAYAIWDDYIDGRRADERFEPLTTAQITEQASIFARASRYLGLADLIALPRAAWGTETFEVITTSPDDTITGKLGWYRGTILNVRALSPAGGHDLTVYVERGKVKYECRIPASQRLSLHPVFGRR